MLSVSGLVALLLMFVLAATVLANAVVIDGFADGLNYASARIPAGGGTATDDSIEPLTTQSLDVERDMFVSANGDSSAGGRRLEGEVFSSTDDISVTAADNVFGYMQIEWDGPDGVANSIDYVGLRNGGATGIDLVDSASGTPNDSIYVELTFNDRPAEITFEVYTDASNHSALTMPLPGDIDASLPGGNHVDILLPFNDFVQTGASGPADFSNVGALVMIVDVTLNPATQVTLDFLNASYWRDFGDLPDDYGLPVTSASHLSQGLRLGNRVDAEPSAPTILGYPGTGADGDDNTEHDLSVATRDDEDGIIIPVGAINTFGDGTGTLQYTIKGNPGDDGCLVGWIDWNDNNQFDAGTSGSNNASELVINQYVEVNATYPASINISSPLAETGVFEYSSGLYARFRLFPTNDPLFTAVDSNGCPTEAGMGTALTTLVIGEAKDGEVEDYLIGFTPTAVSLQSFTPASSSALPVIGFVGFLALAVVSVGMFIVRREQKKA